MFAILSWNILQGGGSRIASIVQKIAEEKPSVIVLSEFRNNESGILLRSSLLRIGFRYQFVTASAKDENSVLIASLLPANCALHPESDPEFSNNIISVEFDPFIVLGAYLPHKKKHRLLPYIHKLIAESSKPYIIVGDFNTGINQLDQNGDSFWYEDELKKFSQIDYVDAFRHLHGNIKEYSWYSHQGNGFRYDHTYVHVSLLPIVKECHYLHHWREEKIADHSPMILKCT